jgi:hypothetical protein
MRRVPPDATIAGTATWISDKKPTHSRDVIARVHEARQMDSNQQPWATQALSCVGATLREATKFVTEEPPPTVLWVLLLEVSRRNRGRKVSRNLPHWTTTGGEEVALSPVGADGALAILRTGGAIKC